MSRLESSAEFARILLSDFESAEKVCDSNSSLNLTKHEIIIRRLNTHMEMEKHDIECIIDTMISECNLQISRLLEISNHHLMQDMISAAKETSFRAECYRANISILRDLLKRMKESERQA